MSSPPGRSLIGVPNPHPTTSLTDSTDATRKHAHSRAASRGGLKHQLVAVLKGLLLLLLALLAGRQGVAAGILVATGAHQGVAEAERYLEIEVVWEVRRRQVVW